MTGASADVLPGMACEIVSRVEHRVRTITLRDVLIGRMRTGTKVFISPQGEHSFRAGQVFLAARGTQWDVLNDPHPQGRYGVQILVPGAGILRYFHTLYPELARAALPVAGCVGTDADAALGEAIDRAASALLGAASEALCRHRLLEVLLLLAERGRVFALPDDESWDDRVRRLIGQRPHADWTIDTLARSFHLSASTLRRRIADHGTTLGELVRETRLECALTLLQSTELPVGEIAVRCGYESHSRFSAAFRGRYGFAPSHLRPVVSRT